MHMYTIVGLHLVQGNTLCGTKCVAKGAFATLTVNESAHGDRWVNMVKEIQDQVVLPQGFGF